MYDRVVLPLGAIGTGKFSWNLKGSYQIASIQVDNPSGSWLLIKEDDTLIAPWTLGVIHNFRPTLAEVTITFVAGPAQKISIQQGDNPTLVINSLAETEFVGTPFTPTSHTQQTIGTMPVAASLTNIAFTGANAGRRIYSIQIDNKSQNWLQLGTYLDVIPPNTVGWTKTLPDAPLSVTVTAMATGPDGSPSIALGDAPVLTIIDDMSFGNSIGNTYVPIIHSKIITTAGFGNLGVTAFTGADLGRLITGVIIDNPSGAWLTLNIGGAAYRVAPYTLRWVKEITPPVINFTSLTFDATGPASQVSSRQGDQVTVTILDQEPDSKDTFFIEGYTPTLGIAVGQVVAASTGIAGQVAIAAVANKRIRVINIIAGLFNQNQNVLAEGTGDLQITPSVSANPNYNIEVSYVPTVIPGPIDFPLGEGINWAFFPNWKNLWIQFTITYQVI